MKDKILVVDDEPDAREMVKLRLEANHYSVMTAANGREALEKTRQELPDLVILDIKMDPMDGYTILRTMRQDALTKDIPVIMLTAYAHMKDLFSLEGATDYILKPYNDQDFILRIASALHKEK